ncbi:hypothetical protein IAR55_003299 [Kwoniella newhampshirensis]|uniref:F-box domain-containing protein n=1 Tax=Kwoniella newhampshirensis TaxID=1651941 RepID=A0AAW0YZ68_9TREE
MRPDPSSELDNTPQPDPLGNHVRSEIVIHDAVDNALITPLRNTTRRRLPSSSNSKGKGVIVSGGGRWKGKGVRDTAEEAGGECHILNLPEDVLHTLLSHLPPRTLTKLAQTCRILYEELESESIWRQSYVNRFFWDGAARDSRAKEEVMILVQGCLNTGGRGWKREALSREAMLDRWTQSKASMVRHTPPAGLVHSLSLSYPPFVPAPPRSLVVGKNHQTPTKGKSPAGPQLTTPTTLQPQTTETNDPEEASESSSTPTKMTHRQKYEAMLAATTRPPPYVLSASLVTGGMVRSDPISGKVSKGFWGPGRDANFHLRPHLDVSATPSAIHLPARSQTYILWGLNTGHCVHTTVLLRHHANSGGRASSVNVQSETQDGHEGEIMDVWAVETPAEDESEDKLRWVTGGADGRIKLWELKPATNMPKTGKRSLNVESVPGFIDCLFTSDVVQTSLQNRSEAVKRKQSGKADGIAVVRYDAEHDAICGVTEDGDLRIWLNSLREDRTELRVDVGAAELYGGVEELDLNVRPDGNELLISVLIRHHRSPFFTRHDISQSGSDTVTTFISPTGSSLTALHSSLRPVSSICLSKDAKAGTILDRSTSPRAHNGVHTSLLVNPSSSQPLPAHDVEFGRFVVGGDESGYVHIWSWDGEGRRERDPIRSWEAMEGKITSIDVSCGLVAVGSYDGYIKIYDPLSVPPTLLRTFHASHLTPGEQLVAASEEPDGRYYTVNQIILENDLVVATLGRKVFAWRAGTGKGRKGGKESGGWRKTSTGKGDGKGSSRGLDMKAIHKAAVDDQVELKPFNTSIKPRVSTTHEAREREAMEVMGLEDGEDALQYALMLSMEDKGGTARSGTEGGDDEPWIDVGDMTSTSSTTPAWAEEELGEEEKGDDLDDETVEAIRQVEAFKKAEEDELGRVLEMIRLAEEKERHGA